MKLGWSLKMQSAPLGASEELVCFQSGVATGFDAAKPLRVVGHLT